MSRDQKPKLPKEGGGKADDGLSQSERFKQAARELGTDDDPERFAERVRKIATPFSKKPGKPKLS